MKKIIILLAALMLFQANARANETTGEKKPTLITSDGPLDADFENKTAVFKDNVVVKDEQGTVKADKMKVFFGNENNEIDKIECRGNVEIRQKDRYSESEEAIYYAAEKKIVLKGDPVIRQESDHYRAEVITIFTEQNRVLFEPSAQLLIFPDEEMATKMSFTSDE